MNDCKYYEILWDSVFVQVDERDGIPIEEETYIMLGEACHLKETYDFDCSTCKEKG